MKKKFHALDRDGLARIGEKLSDGDVFIHKYVPDVDMNQYRHTALDIQNLEFKPEFKSF